jgi:MFS family permease
VAFFSAGLVSLLLAINKSTDLGWTSPAVVSLCAAAFVLGLGWITQERRADTPFIDLGMMRARGVWTSNLVAFLVGMALFGHAAALPQLLQTPTDSGYGVHASLMQVGWLMMPTPLLAFGASLFTGRLVRRFSSRVVLSAGTVCSAVSFLGFAYWHETGLQICAWGALQGLGNGLILSTLAGVIVASVPGHQTGIANGMNTNLRTMGGSLGAAMAASIIGVFVLADGYPAEQGFVIVYSLMAGFMMVATLAAFFVPGRGRFSFGDAAAHRSNAAEPGPARGAALDPTA